MVDCAEYLVVLTGEFRCPGFLQEPVEDAPRTEILRAFKFGPSCALRLEKRDEKIMLREGDGIFLEAELVSLVRFSS